MGLLIDKDTLIRRKQFKEMAKLIGVKAKYSYIYNEDKHYTTHTELKGTYSTPMFVDIIIHDLASMKNNTFRKLGWVTEGDKESLPVIAQVPFDLPHLQRGCHILLKSDGTNTPKTFRITEIYSAQQYPDSWYVKLAPEFETVISGVNNNYSRADFNYVENDDD